MSKLVLIDASWLAHKARYATNQLSHEDMSTGIVFGFLEQLRTACLNPRVASNYVVICFDSKQSYRKDAHSFYKAKRAKNRTDEEWTEINTMQEQVQLLRKEILPAIGIPCLMQAGLESDDLIAQAALQHAGDGVIITADRDLLQCVTDRMHWYDLTRNVYLDVAGMLREFTIGPADFALMKCIAGCDSDNVPGIQGVGEKTATDYIWKLLKPGVKLSRIESVDGQKIIERNKTLIMLPHKRTMPVKLDQPVYNPDALFSWARSLGFKSYGEGPRRALWDRFFGGQMSVTDRQTVRKRGQ